MNDQLSRDMEWLIYQLEYMYTWNGWHGRTEHEKDSYRRRLEEIRRRFTQLGGAGE